MKRIEPISAVYETVDQEQDTPTPFYKVGEPRKNNRKRTRGRRTQRIKIVTCWYPC